MNRRISNRKISKFRGRLWPSHVRRFAVCDLAWLDGFGNSAVPQAPLDGISAQISFDANLRALVTVNVAANYFDLNSGRSAEDVSFPQLQTTAGRSLGFNVAHSGIEGFVGRLRLRILPPAPPS